MGVRRVYARERITGHDSTVKTLTAATYGTFSYGKTALIEVRTNPVLFTLDGTDPSASVGTQVAAGNYIVLESYHEITGFKFLNQTAGSNTVLEIQYRKD